MLFTLTVSVSASGGDVEMKRFQPRSQSSPASPDRGGRGARCSTDSGVLGWPDGVWCKNHCVPVTLRGADQQVENSKTSNVLFSVREELLPFPALDSSPGLSLAPTVSSRLLPSQAACSKELPSLKPHGPQSPNMACPWWGAGRLGVVVFKL